MGIETIQTPTPLPAILHVDDDRLSRMIIQDELAGAGEFISAASLAEARKALASRRFELVLLDLTLPDGAGLDLLPDVGAAKVVILSGSVPDGEAVRRAAAILDKSQVDELRGVVARLLGGG
ncbi:MAG: hypothetical protein GMKNLPBB_02989 [Myxococcota bacterium]|nr:hypothetical protein [Myxococcota bacterium]